MEEAKDWRELLGLITSDPEVMRHLIENMNVRDITVKRWVKGTSGPRSQNLRRLLNAMPEHRERLLALFSDHAESLFGYPLDEAVPEISAKVYTQIFQMRSVISKNQRYWSLANTIIGEALRQLSAENLGIAISIVRCMRSSRHEKIYSLRQSLGQGTEPWPGSLDQKSMFLGAESLTGYAVSICRPAEVQDYQEDQAALLGHQFELEQSASAYPIIYAGRIAGCLLISSSEPYSLLSVARQSLLSDYADLMTLAFEPGDFFEPSQIELRILPLHVEQQRYFDNFRKRLTDTKLRLYEQRLEIDAEQSVWEDIEDEIFEDQKQKYRQAYENR